MPLRIGLTYDIRPAQRPTDQWDEWDEPETIAAIEGGLQALGHDVIRIGSAHEFLRQLPSLRDRIDLIFNLAEGRGSRTREAQVPTLCELVSLPYVGSSPQTLAIALDKWATKQLWRAEGLPIPEGVVIRTLDELAHANALNYPLIVKPRYEGSGVGLDCDAIVHSHDELVARVTWLIETYHQPALIEEFIRGGEVTVCLAGDPFEALPPVQRHVDPETTLSCHIAQKSCPTKELIWQLPLAMTAALEQRCSNLALRVCQALGCRDLARVDLRVARDGAPCLLEMNPLPSLDASSTFVFLAELLGWGFDGLLQRIIEPAINRSPIPVR